MRGYILHCRMAARRRAASLLVVLFTAAATVFLLTYPRLIQSTGARLEEAYASLEVTGWLLNAADYEDPHIPGALWHTLVDSGYFSRCTSYASTSANLVSRAALSARAGENTGDSAELWALQALLAAPDTAADRSAYARDTLRALSSLAACADLERMAEDIQWLEGHGPDCLEGEERICLLPESLGYAPGDTVPLLVRPADDSDTGGIVRLTVAGIYPGSIPELDCAMPLGTYEQLRRDAGWDFVLHSFVFTVADNHRLDEVKHFLIRSGLDGSGEGSIRAAVDDRILQSTVSPIASNLALLEGLYRSFFLMLILLGFFLSFLLARGRRQEHAIMRLLGESAAQVTAKALLEQGTLCLLGVALGAGCCLAALRSELRLSACGSIWLCYTLGAAAATLLTVRVNVMEILRDKE